MDDEPTRSSKKQRKVQFAAATAVGQEPSLNELVYFVVIEVDLDSQVLLRHGGVEVDIAQNTEYILAVQSIEEARDAEDLLAFTEKYFRMAMQFVRK